MAFTQELIAQRINRIRKLKQISVHDCASILGISKEQFLLLEETLQPLTLPEIRLLAIYFGVPIAVFFDENAEDIKTLSLLENETRSTFLQLSHKAISAKLTIEMNDHKITAEDIHQATDIPVDTIRAYQTGKRPIPIDHLSQIITFVDIPLDVFFEDEVNYLYNQSQVLNNTQWHPEYPEPKSFSSTTSDETLENLFNVLENLPKEDQAQITKFLIEKLKAI